MTSCRFALAWPCRGVRPAESAPRTSSPAGWVAPVQSPVHSQVSGLAPLRRQGSSFTVCSQVQPLIRKRNELQERDHVFAQNGCA